MREGSVGAGEGPYAQEREHRRRRWSVGGETAALSREPERNPGSVSVDAGAGA